MDSKKINIALFCSGSGSNAEKIIEYFKTREDVNISILLTNNPSAYAIERAKRLGVPYLIFDRNTFYNSQDIVEELKRMDISWIILAGFLWLVPNNLIKNFPERIINIHPALLPKFGGKGMYGMKVHQAVVEAKEKESGITIHIVNENYDEGAIVFQATCCVDEEDTPEIVARKVQVLEHEHFPKVIDELIKKSIKNI